MNFLPISPNEKMSTDFFIIDNKKTLETESIINSSTLGVIGVVVRTRGRHRRKTSFLSDSAYRHTDSDHAEWGVLTSGVNSRGVLTVGVHFGFF